MASAWNAPAATYLGEHRRNFCWGGGTAIRRALFEEMGMLDVWQNSFSDDYSLTIAIERTRRQIVFVPECLTPSYVQTDFPSLLEFTNRQIKITRIYRPKMWAAAFATHFLYCFTLLLGFIVALNLTIESRPPRRSSPFSCFPCFSQPSAAHSV